MKSLFRFLIVATCLGIVIFYSAIDHSKPLEIEENEVKELENVEEHEFNNVSLQRPTKGLSTYVGQSIEEVIEEYKEPNRIEKTPYQYDWWIYNLYEMYLMFGVQDGVVKQVYTNSSAYDVSPYTMYMSNEEIFRMTIIDGEISVELGDNIYIYSMNDYDIDNRILVRLEDLYAQLYLDANQKKLVGIRYMDGETLVAHQPYEMQFIGEFDGGQPLHFTEEINYANAQLLFELTNVFRLKEKLPTLNYSSSLSQLAQSHSQDMFEGQFVSHDSPTYGSLKKRAERLQLAYDKIDENIAKGFYDAIEAVHSLSNSDKHRKLMYNEEYLEMGVGVKERYYTQVFLKPLITDVN